MPLLGDIAAVSTGQSAPQDIDAFSDQGIPFVRAGSLQDLINGKGENALEKIRPEIADKYRLKLFPVNTIVFAKSGMSAKLGRVYKLMQPCYVVSHLATVEPKESVDPDYLFRWFESHPPSKLINNDAYPSIKTSVISKLDIPLPNLPDQKRIAAILDKADAIRRKRQQAIELADQFLRSVFLDFFGDLNKTMDRKVLLGEVVSVDAPMVDPKQDEYLDLIHIGPDRIEKETGKLLPAMTAREEGLISNKFLFDERYVLYSKIRPYLKKCALAVGRGLCSADMYPIRPAEGEMTREFLWMLLLSGPFDAYVASLPARANIPKLNRAELSAFEFALPDFASQMKFSEVVKRTNSFKNKLLKSNDTPEQLFGSLSQKAFAGQL